MKKTIQTLLELIKRNKLTTLLIFAIIFLILRSNNQNIGSYRTSNLSNSVIQKGISGSSSDARQEIDSANGIMSNESYIPVPPSQSAPPSDSTNRIIIRNTTMSVLVKDVKSSLDSIMQKTTNLGGFLVDSHLSKPEESASGFITIRIPAEKLDEAIGFFRSVGIRVIDETISGSDVTDQYEDLDTKLTQFRKTKEKFETIFNQASEISDILNIQKEILNIQRNIDNVIGQQQYLEKSAKLSRVTVYLSTDEQSLPYAPAQPWRPEVIFKLAVRSLIARLQLFAGFIIWIVVYSVIWFPLALIGMLLYKKYYKS